MGTKDAGFSLPPGPDDKTGQILRIAEKQESTESQVTALAKRTKFWIAFLMLIAGGAWAAAVYFGGFAKTGDVEKVNMRIDATNDRVGKVESQQAVQSAISTRIEEDLHWIRRQESENAKATGARQVPPPSHDKGE